MSIVKSFFIPTISYGITKNILRDYFSYCGQVSRIDFVSFNSDKGVGRRAFVHFLYYDNNSRYAQEIDYDIREKGVFEGSIPCGGGWWKISVYINKNPVPFTSLNIDQVASNTDFLGEKIKEQDAHIETLESRIADLEKLVKKLTNHVPLEIDCSFGDIVPEPLTVQDLETNTFIETANSCGSPYSLENEDIEYQNDEYYGLTEEERNKKIEEERFNAQEYEEWLEQQRIEDERSDRYAEDILERQIYCIGP